MLQIEITRGYVTTIDDMDSDLASFRWRAHVDKEANSVYVVREVTDSTRFNGRRTDRLHRIILSRVLDRELLPNEFVDHINLNGLDNRRENLRLATKAQNMRNTTLRKTNTSGYKGVQYLKHTGKWAAYITYNYRNIYLGSYKTAEEAAAAYREKAEELFEEFARASG